MPQTNTSYHHGNLRVACLKAARELLEEKGSLSVRAVARRAGVSPTAPYRHFAHRDALLSAVAAQGYHELGASLASAHPSPSAPEDLVDIGLAYVRFALDHRALFRVMFAEPCEPTSPERVAAAEALNDHLHDLVRRTLDPPDPEAMATTLWALVHGLAFLHLDGKLDAAHPEVVATEVGSAISAMLEFSRGTPSP